MKSLYFHEKNLYFSHFEPSRDSTLTFLQNTLLFLHFSPKKSDENCQEIVIFFLARFARSDFVKFRSTLSE